MSRRPHKRRSRLERAYESYADRVTAARLRKALNHIFPDHWSFMLGELALYSFIFLVITGIFLALYFVPSDATVVYEGPYIPLHGVHVSEAYASTLGLSFTVRAGLLVRQAHHWAADIFLGAIVVHMARIFFTGAFRRPRELNWVIGATMLMLAMFNGFLGYSLPGDLASGQGVRIAYSILEGVPVVGPYLVVFLFGRNFPGTIITERFFLLHVFILPILILALLGLHLALVWRQEHTEFKAPSASEGVATGTPLWPAFMAKSTGFMLCIFGAITALAATVQINPIWQYGPYLPPNATDAAQPDWYMGWLEGALRLWPPLETRFLDHDISALFYPGVLLPVLTWLFIYTWPLLESFFKIDHKTHNILNRPRDAPVRTAFGVAALAFYGVLTAAGGDDVLASFLNLSLNDVLTFFQIAVLVLPPLSGFVAWRICHHLQRLPASEERARHVVLRRTEVGAYDESPGLPLPVETKPAPLDVELPGTLALARDGADAAGGNRQPIRVEEAQ